MPRRKPPELPLPTPMDNGDYAFHVPLPTSTVTNLLLQSVGHARWASISTTAELEALIGEFFMGVVERGPIAPMAAIANLVNVALGVDTPTLVTPRSLDVISPPDTMREDLHVFAVPMKPEEVANVVASIGSTDNWNDLANPKELNRMIVGWLAREAEYGIETDSTLVESNVARLLGEGGLTAIEAAASVEELATATSQIPGSQTEMLRIGDMPELETTS